MRPIIWPYNPGSHSARALRESLNRVHPNWARTATDRRRYTYYPNHVVINWGNSSAIPANWQTTSDWNINILNHPSRVNVAGNKLLTLRDLRGNGVPCPDFWERRAGIPQDFSGTIVVRHALRGHSGEGIELCDVTPNTRHGIPQAPLYVKYVKKVQEFRVHVFGTDVIDVQEKRRERDAERVTELQKRIRSRDNGWVFCRENIREPADLRSVAFQALDALGLYFGAVDIVYNQRENRCYVLEVNTAPGLEGTSLDIYTRAVVNVCNRR